MAGRERDPSDENMLPTCGLRGLADGVRIALCDWHGQSERYAFAVRRAVALKVEAPTVCLDYLSRNVQTET